MKRRGAKRHSAENYRERKRERRRVIAGLTVTQVDSRRSGEFGLYVDPDAQITGADVTVVFSYFFFFLSFIED